MKEAWVIYVEELGQMTTVTLTYSDLPGAP
jgi:hypothetical protein